MSSIVLDSSALLTILNREPGVENLTPEILMKATCSTVSLAEVHSKLVSRGVPEKDAWIATSSAIEEAQQFTSEHARLAGGLISHTKSLGLSLGDRACLALGLQLSARVYTADKAWKKLKLPIEIHVIR